MLLSQLRQSKCKCFIKDTKRERSVPVKFSQNGKDRNWALFLEGSFFMKFFDLWSGAETFMNRISFFCCLR